MCIAAFAWQSHPLYPLILLLNRDEYYSRPTKPAEWWEGGEILGGRDEKAGGTWLASSRSGRVSFVTNVREARGVVAEKSRGDLPVRFLQSKKSAMEFAQEVIEEADLYGGFNLVLVDFCTSTMLYVTNRQGEDKQSIKHISPGIHVLTNATLDSPWPKAERLAHNFEELLNAYGSEEVDPHLMVQKLMTDSTKEASMLPGVYPPEFEYQLSSIFVECDTPLGCYGTRSTSAVFFKLNEGIRFYERYLAVDYWQDQTFSFQIKDD
ncbi:Transport and Golgi organization 2-like protein [Drosera capensis]